MFRGSFTVICPVLSIENYDNRYKAVFNRYEVDFWTLSSVKAKHSPKSIFSQTSKEGDNA